MAKWWSSMQQMVLFLQRQASASAKFLLHYFFGISILFLITNNVYAADFHTILTNIRKVINPLTVLILSVAYIAGIFMIFKAITMMKKFGQLMSMQSQPGEFGGPMTYLLVGAALIYLPTTTDVFMNSVFGTAKSIFSGGGVDYANLGTGASILGYSGASSFEQNWADLANTLVLFIQLLGLLSFVKGWFIMAKAGQPGGHQGGGFGKAITHILGGVIALNFIGFYNVLKNTIFGT